MIPPEKSVVSLGFSTALTSVVVKMSVAAAKI
jgi:hypothetical protein